MATTKTYGEMTSKELAKECINALCQVTGNTDFDKAHIDSVIKLLELIESKRDLMKIASDRVDNRSGNKYGLSDTQEKRQFNKSPDIPQELIDNATGSQDQKDDIVIPNEWKEDQIDEGRISTGHMMSVQNEIITCLHAMKRKMNSEWKMMQTTVSKGKVTHYVDGKKTTIPADNWIEWMSNEMPLNTSQDEKFDIITMDGVLYKSEPAGIINWSNVRQCRVVS